MRGKTDLGVLKWNTAEGGWRGRSSERVAAGSAWLMIQVQEDRALHHQQEHRCYNKLCAFIVP